MRAILSHKEKMIRDIANAVDRGDSVRDISKEMLAKACDYRRRGACEAVIMMYLKAGCKVSCMTIDSLRKSIKSGAFV